MNKFFHTANVFPVYLLHLIYPVTSSFIQNITIFKVIVELSKYYRRTNTVLYCISFEFEFCLSKFFQIDGYGDSVILRQIPLTDLEWPSP